MVMGILNSTPDSFYPFSRVEENEALNRVREWERLGCDLVDVGGESSRPGSESVDIQTELSRVLPVVERLTQSCRIPISIDTTKPAVMRACAQLGASWLNDISALEDPEMIDIVKEFNLNVILMHKKGDPKTMQINPEYQDVVSEVKNFLLNRAQHALQAGIPREHIWLDPGIGFGKKLEHNLQLLHALPELSRLGFPVVVGLSRKRWIGDLWGEGDRLAGSLVGAIYCLTHGATMVRVHDVPETLQAITVMRALWTKF